MSVTLSASKQCRQCAKQQAYEMQLRQWAMYEIRTEHLPNCFHNIRESFVKFAFKKN